MTEETLEPHEALGAMVVMSEQVPALDVAAACIELATILSESHDSLDPEVGRRLLVLGGALWNKARALGENVTAFDTLYARRH